MIKSAIIITILISIFWVHSAIGQDNLNIEKTGIYVGLNFGTWFPDGNNKVLGNPTIFGFSIELKQAKNSFGLNFDLIGLLNRKTTEPITIKFGDSLLVRNEYYGAQITIDYSRQFLETNRFLFEGLCSIGYGKLTYYNPDQFTNVDKSSFVLSPGLNIRYALSRKLFLQMKVQYCLANYKLDDKLSTDLKGNYWMTKLVFSRFYYN